MAVTVKADTQDFPAILKAFGFGSTPDSTSAETLQTAQPASDAAGEQPTGPRLPFLQNTANSIAATQQPVDVPGPDYSKIGTPSLPPAGISQPSQQAPQYQDKGSWYRDPGETKGHALMRILTAGIQGGLAGAAQNSETYAQTGRNAGFGGGIYGAQMLPLQRAALAGQAERIGLENQQLAQMLPFLRAQTLFGLQKTKADIDKTTAETGKATAEANAIPIKTALERAQTEAAYYKEDPMQGLIDIRTGKPVTSDANLVPLSDQEAAILGKPSGSSVPLKIKNMANEIVQRGITPGQANGRSVLIDKNTRQVVADLGAATPMAVINAQMSGPAVTPSGALADPNMEAVAQSVAGGKQDLATALRPYMRFPGKANALEARVLQINPEYYQGDYTNRLKVLEKATQGSWADQKIAFNTMLQHADLLDQAAKALNNKDTKAYNAVKNKLASEFGDADLTNFQAIANAYNHEVTSVISKGHITDSEVKQGDATMPSNANYDTIHKVLSSYKALAESKMRQLNKQIQTGMEGTKGLTDQGPTADELLNKYPPKKK